MYIYNIYNIYNIYIYIYIYISKCINKKIPLRKKPVLRQRQKKKRIL